MGFRPTTPQKLAGSLTDPPVSEPKAAKAIQAATAAAEPPEDPPATLSVSKGFLVAPKAEFSVEPPIANSSIFTLPRKTAPSSINFFITVAS